MSAYAQWEILFARIPNSDGTAAPYPHRCIFLGDSPKFIGKIVVLRITSDLTRRVKGFSIDLPWADGGHPETGLFKPSIAQLLWTDHISLESVIRVEGVVPTPQRIQIASGLARRKMLDK